MRARFFAFHIEVMLAAGTLREAVRDQYLFATLDDVRETTWRWMIEYNEQRLTARSAT